MSLLTKPSTKGLRTTYGYCGCGARITQNAKASVCIICSGFVREQEALDRSHRMAAMSPWIDLGSKAPRYMDGEVVEE